MSKKSKSKSNKTPVLPAALEANAVTKRYGDLVALQPLNLSIAKGQRVTLVGANGSGKTTLLRLAAGLLDITEGEISIAGNPAGSLEARRLLSYIPDDPVLYDDLSVREHVEYLGPLSGLEDWATRGEELAVRLGLAHRFDDLPSGFSRGLRQKTSLVLGLLRPASVLLVDEPFVGLDEPGRQALLGLLDEIAQAGTTVVVASHQLDLVKQADRCIALADGQLRYDGSPETVDLAKLVSA